MEKDKVLSILAEKQIEEETVNRQVLEIVENVRRDGDSALKAYTEKFDGVLLENFEVSGAEIMAAYKSTPQDLIDALERSKANIEAYHKRQVRETVIYKEGKQDIVLGQLIKPIEKVALYVPGGLAPYPSSVLMNALPAKIAGVDEVIMMTPPNKDGSISPVILAAAKIAGVDRIFKIGGAQGVAAFAYGTETVPQVDKIVGPGNIYVATAKKIVSGTVGIDMVAGPSEIVVLADEWANPAFVAADLLSQAEHDERAASILVTDSATLAERVEACLAEQVEKLDKKEICLKALKNNGKIILVNDMAYGVDLVNKIAPEHLEILTRDPFEFYKKIRNAGAIFLGEYTPEPVGDYYAGTNHVLPTCGTARFNSALSVDDFIVKTSLIYYSQSALTQARADIELIANAEGLTAHRNAVAIRFSEGGLK
ncbi:MAG: histidinol dehydrogenase [Clostridia bacterium]|nr:histidinol dehydrogenase [Clostridia bacterium]